MPPIMLAQQCPPLHYHAAMAHTHYAPSSPVSVLPSAYYHLSEENDKTMRPSLCSERRRRRAGGAVRFAPLPPSYYHRAQQERRREEQDEKEEEESGNLWYTKTDIDNFKKTARATSVMRRNSLNSSTSSSSPPSSPRRPPADGERRTLSSPPPPPCAEDESDDDEDNEIGSDSDDDDDCNHNDDESDETLIPRGLEHRVSLDRQRRKLLVMKSVVAYQRRISVESQDNQDDEDRSTPQECVADRLARYAERCTRWARNVALATGQSDFLEVYPGRVGSVYGRAGSGGGSGGEQPQRQVQQQPFVNVARPTSPMPQMPQANMGSNIPLRLPSPPADRTNKKRKISDGSTSSCSDSSSSFSLEDYCSSPGAIRRRISAAESQLSSSPSSSASIALPSLPPPAEKSPPSPPPPAPLLPYDPELRDFLQDVLFSQF